VGAVNEARVRHRHEQCARCGKLKLIAAIEEPAVFEKILQHIGLDPKAPPRAKARRMELFEAA